MSNDLYGTGLRMKNMNGFSMPNTNPGYGFSNETDLLNFGSNWGAGSDFNYTLPTSVTAAAPKLATEFKWNDMKSWSPWMRENGWLDNIDKDGNKTQGMAGLGLSALQGLGNAFMAMKQYGLMKENLDFQKDSYYRNFEAQKGLTNSQLADRQDRRVREAQINGTAAPVNTAEYMARYGVK